MRRGTAMARATARALTKVTARMAKAKAKGRHGDETIWNMLGTKPEEAAGPRWNTQIT